MSDETKAGGIFAGTLTEAEHRAAQEAHERTPGVPVGVEIDTPPMKERLAKALWQHEYGGTAEFWDNGIGPSGKEIYTKRIDAILDEMQTPSEAMIDAMMRGFHVNEAPRQAMTDALINGLCSIREGK